MFSSERIPLYSVSWNKHQTNKTAEESNWSMEKFIEFKDDSKSGIKTNGH
jgi:hypothetical protein